MMYITTTYRKPDEHARELYQDYGMLKLSNDYFESHMCNQNDLDNWKKGFSFELHCIKALRELRREKMIADVKRRIENEHKLLILGQSGSSKSTILMELICDYFENGYKILYSFGSTHIKNAD